MCMRIIMLMRACFVCTMQRTVVRVLHAWNRWSLYPAVYLEGLMVSFLRTKEGALPSKVLDSFEPVEGCTLGMCSSICVSDMREEKFVACCVVSGLLCSVSLELTLELLNS
jgi:hypothetical protein